VTDLDARPEEGVPSTLFSTGTWGAPVTPRRRRSGFVAGLAVGALVAGGLGGAFLLGRSSGSAGPLAAAPVATSAVPASTVPATTAPLSTAPATSSSASIPAPAAPGLALPAADPAAPVVPRSALYAGGTVLLRGSVPAVEVAEAIVAKVAAVVGPDHVAVEYALDPRAVVDQRVPLQVADTVLFEPGSAAVTPDFLPLLDLGAALLTQNPSVTMTILGHTDSHGTPEANLLLSKQRVDAVAAELAARGVDPAQLVAVPMGADAPVADNATAEGRRVNRRVEFRVAGLLDA
jgi:outer membrane protein OmpA-like peptidoglycan-associated protein